MIISDADHSKSSSEYAGAPGRDPSALLDRAAAVDTIEGTRAAADLLDCCCAAPPPPLKPLRRHSISQVDRQLPMLMTSRRRCARDRLDAKSIEDDVSRRRKVA